MIEDYYIKNGFPNWILYSVYSVLVHCMFVHGARVAQSKAAVRLSTSPSQSEAVAALRLSPLETNVDFVPFAKTVISH